MAANKKILAPIIIGLSACVLAISITVGVASWEAYFLADNNIASRYLFDLSLTYYNGDSVVYENLERHSNVKLPTLANNEYVSVWTVGGITFSNTVTIKDIFDADDSKSSETEGNTTTYIIHLFENYISTNTGYARILVSSAYDDTNSQDLDTFEEYASFTSIETKFYAFNINASFDGYDISFYRYYYGEGNSSHKDYYPNDAMLLTSNSEPFHDELDDTGTITFEAHFEESSNE